MMRRVVGIFFALVAINAEESTNATTPAPVTVGPSPFEEAETTGAPSTIAPQVAPTPIPTPLGIVVDPVPTALPTTPGPSFFPTRDPTSSAPSIPPTPRPTVSPRPTATPSASPFPTSQPTIEPSLTVLPINVTMNVTKPARGVETLFLINLSDRDLEQCLVLNTPPEGAIVPDYTITLETGEVVASKGKPGAPITITNEVGANSQQARLSIASSGLPRTAGGNYPYDLEFHVVDVEDPEVRRCDNNATFTSPSSNSVAVRLYVESTADPENTEMRIQNDSIAVLGREYDGLRIIARDVEGQVVTWESVESFAVDLVARRDELRASCNVRSPRGDDDFYPVTCVLPNVANAGDWDVEFFVKNTDTETDQFVEVVCPTDTYQSLDGDLLCVDCGKDMVCDSPGLTLETVGLRKGKWRASRSSTFIYDCGTTGTCENVEKFPDPLVPNVHTYDAHGDSVCDVDRSKGVLCRECEYNYRYDLSKDSCVKCGNRLYLSLVLAAYCVITIVGALAVVWLAKKMGATNDLSEFVREAVRYGSGDGTIRVLRRRTRTPYSSGDTGGPSLAISDSLGGESMDDDAKAQRNALLQRLKVSLLNKCKILIAFFQILSSMPWVLNQIRFPRAFQTISNAFSFFDLYILRVTALKCFHNSWNFYHVLFTSTTVPVFVSIVLYLGTWSRIEWVKRRVSTHDDSEAILDAAQHELETNNDPAGNKRLSFPLSLEKRRIKRLEIKRAKAIREVRNQGIFLWLLLSFLIYPSVSTVCFQFFSCEKFKGFENARGNERVLQVDYSISCRSRNYKLVYYYALCMLLIYPIGIPFVYFCMLWSHRKGINPDLDDESALASLNLSPEDQSFIVTAGRELGFVKQLLKYNKREKDPNIRHLSFLYEEYECRAYLFSVFDCLRKLALSGLLVFLYPGSSTQIGFATLFALLCAKIYTHVRPYVEDEDDIIAEFAMEALSLFFFLSLMLYVSTECDEAENQTNKATRVFAGPVFSAVTIALICSLLFLTFTIILLEVFGYEALSNALTSRLSSTNVTKRNVLRTLSAKSATNLNSPGSTPRNSINEALSPRNVGSVRPKSASEMIHPQGNGGSDDPENGRSPALRRRATSATLGDQSHTSSSTGSVVVRQGHGQTFLSSSSDIFLNIRQKEEKDSFSSDGDVDKREYD